MPRPGDVVGGRYVVERVIGGGGMGAVVAARHVRLNEAVAVKFLHPRLAKDAANVERFVREARAASRIKSEHVIRVHDVGATDQGLPYIAMELLEGIDLGRLLERGPLPIPLAVDCVLQAAEALAEAHAAGIVHRDVKPSNLWLSERSDGTPNLKVLDFGISKLVTVQEDAKLTETNAVFGSPAYMSPEQIRSAKRVDHRTDVWALGVVLYELLTTKAPFEADNVAGVLAAITADPPHPIRAQRPDVPAQLADVIATCLEKEPARRASLKDLAIGLRPFASPAGRIAAGRVDAMGLPRISVLPAPAPMSSADLASFAVTDTRPDVTRPRLSRPILLALLGAVVLILAVVGVKVFLMGSASTSHATRAEPEQASATPVATVTPAQDVPGASATSTPSAEPIPTPSAEPNATASARTRPRTKPTHTATTTTPTPLSEGRQ